MIEQSKHYALAITCGAKRGPKDTDLIFSPSSLRDFLKALAEQPAQQQELEALENGDVPTPENVGKNLDAITALRERLAQEPNMPEQYVMVGRFMLQPHPENGYWLTDTGTSEGMQIFQPEMEQVIKKLWSQF